MLEGWGMKSDIGRRLSYQRPPRRRVNCRTVGKCDGVRQLALRRKVCGNVFIKRSETLKLKTRPRKMLRPGLLPALRRIGSASAGGSNPSRGSWRIVSFPAEEYNRANL